jgi:DNA-binding transcriptional MerR regulator
MRLSNRGTSKTSLSPVDPEELLKRLQLTTGKAAEFCDISRRQLCYWTDKAIVETIEGEGEPGEEGTRRVYDFAALRKVILIKQLLEQGRGLKRATREVDAALQQMQEDELQADADRRVREDTLQRQTDRLAGMVEQVRSAVQRGRLSPAEQRRLAIELHYFMELMTYEENATLQLQEDVGAANQFHALIEQLALHVEEMLAEASPAARRGFR